MRVGSPITPSATDGSMRQPSWTGLPGLGASVRTMLPTTSRRLNGMCSKSSRPASILEKSRISSISVSSASDDCFTSDRYSRCSALRSVSSASSVMPMMAFIGVRISWLMFARKSLFARLAASAASRAAIICSSAALRSPMSDRKAVNSARPFMWVEVIAIWAGKRRPLRVLTWRSRWWPITAS